MKTLVVGLGSIGSRHIKNIKDIDANMRISIWRQNSKETELGELESSVDNVFLCQEDAQLDQDQLIFT